VSTENKRGGEKYTDGEEILVNRTTNIGENDRTKSARSLGKERGNFVDRVLTKVSEAEVWSRIHRVIENDLRVRRRGAPQNSGTRGEVVSKLKIGRDES